MAKSEEKVGFYVGIVASSFAVTQFLSAMPWGTGVVKGAKDKFIATSSDCTQGCSLIGSVGALFSSQDCSALPRR